MIRYLILGAVQGLTEFLPISSSGHLVLAERILGLDPPGILLEALLHLGTLLAILLVFRHDLLRLARSFVRKGEERNETVRLLVGTLPIAVFGFLLQKRIESAFASTFIVGICFLINGGILCIAEWSIKRAHRSRTTLADALLIGLAQAAALLPGISRSGATISTGLLRGITGRAAARFSFLLAVPAVLGGGLYQLLESLHFLSAYQGEWVEFLFGMAAAAFIGVLAIKALLALIMRGKLKIFGVYCIVLGFASLIYSHLT